jgi:hypothetical protein
LRPQSQPSQQLRPQPSQPFHAVPFNRLQAAKFHKDMALASTDSSVKRHHAGMAQTFLNGTHTEEHIRAWHATQAPAHLAQAHLAPQTLKAEIEEGLRHVNKLLVREDELHKTTVNTRAHIVEQLHELTHRHASV